MTMFDEVRVFHRMGGLPVADALVELEPAEPGSGLYSVLMHAAAHMHAAALKLKAVGADLSADPATDRAARRFRFMLEELAETIDAAVAGDMAELADGMADLIWVTLGSAVEYGIPFQAVWDEVNRSNMAKYPTCSECAGTGRPIADLPWCPRCRGTGRVVLKDAAGKVMKPDGWTPPNIARVLQMERDDQLAALEHAPVEELVRKSEAARASAETKTTTCSACGAQREFGWSCISCGGEAMHRVVENASDSAIRERVAAGLSAADLSLSPLALHPESSPPSVFFADIGGDPGWHFYDETWSVTYGPYATEEIAKKAQSAYANNELNCPEPHAGQVWVVEDREFIITNLQRIEGRGTLASGPFGVVYDTAATKQSNGTHRPWPPRGELVAGPGAPWRIAEMPAMIAAKAEGS